MHFTTWFAQPDKHDSTARLVFKVRETPIAKKWATAVKNEIEKGSSPYEPNRFYNFPGDQITLSSVCTEINKCLQIIGEFYSGPMPDPVEPPLTANDTNRLHRYFEIFRGSLQKPSALYLNGPPQLQRAIERFNVEIHRYENLSRIPKGQEVDYARIVWSWTGRTRYPLDDEDYAYFTIGSPFGTVNLNYCEVGKHLIEVFRDKDRDFVSPENIRPLRHYSADAMIWLGVEPSLKRKAELMREFDNWWDEVNLSRLGFKKGDPKNALGLVQVADLVWPNDVKDRVELVCRLAKYRHMLRASLSENCPDPYNMIES